MTIKYLVKLFILISLISHLAAVRADTDVDPNDRHPQADDVIVPMPCGIKMVFKKVYTSYNGSDMLYAKFQDGLEDGKTSTPASEGPFMCSVRGQFTDNKGRYMLIAKYELMKYQYDAIQNYKNNKKCPSPKVANKERIPKVEIDYFSAMELAEIYTRFLSQTEDAPAVEGGKKAIAAVTSNCAWSFAARGGLNVSEEELIDRLPPLVNKNFEDHVWYGSPLSANHKIQVTGLKEPNELGLYDMFGNVKEMMSERFKARRYGLEIGESGGIVVRGGSFLNSKESIYSARRAENENTPAKDTGLRLMLTAPSVYSSKEEFKNINKDAVNNNNSSNNAYSDSILLTISSIIAVISLLVIVTVAFMYLRKKKNTSEDTDVSPASGEFKKAQVKEIKKTEESFDNSDAVLEGQNESALNLKTKTEEKPKSTISEKIQKDPKISAPSVCFRGASFKIMFSDLPLDSRVKIELENGLSALPSNVAKADDNGNAALVLSVDRAYQKDCIRALKVEVVVLDLVISTLYIQDISVKEKPAEPKTKKAEQLQNTSQINQKKTASFEESAKAKEPSSVESVKVNAPSFEENVKRETPKTSILKKRTIYTPETKEELRKMVSDNSISLKDIDISKVNDLSKLFAAVKRDNFSGIEQWDVSHATNTSFMFFNQTCFNEDISEWKFSKLQKAERMFYGAKSFNCNLHKWKLPQDVVKTDMFKGTPLENRPPEWFKTE